jgi:methylthioribose-1-phosphate isomerase
MFIRTFGMVRMGELRTVSWKDGKVILIDQTKLPTKFTYIECRNQFELADAIKRMIVRGAPAIGVAAAMGIALAAKNSKAKSNDEFLNEIKSAGKLMIETRPTAANIRWGVERILNKVKRAIGKKEVNELVNDIVSEVVKMADEDVKVNKMIGRYGAGLIKDGDVVLTHCKWL